MAYQLKDGQGSLGANPKKTEDRHPDIKGKFMLNGKLHYVSGWRKIRQDGGIWYSLAVNEADESAQMDRHTGEGQSNEPGF